MGDQRGVDEMTAWLRACVDADEAAAKAAASVAGPGWRRDGRYVRSAGGAYLFDAGGHVNDEVMAPFCAEFDPARVLREVAAKRAILAEIEAMPHYYSAGDPAYSCMLAVDPEDPEQGPGSGWSNPSAWVGPYYCNCGRDALAARLLRHLTAVYRDRPGYRKEWAP